VFEEALRAADRALRPQATEFTSVPYWRWADPFPSWLEGFLPARLPDGSVPPPRTLISPPPKPTLTDVGVIVTGFGKQLAGQAAPDYVRFTVGLEGWGLRPDGTSLPAHNHVHDWVGGVMSDPMRSPVDPVFWLHHAEVDRLWAIWQTTHSTAMAPLTGKDRVLDPWPETIADVNDPVYLGYKYASVVP
jgi:tyrosinase